MRMAHAPFFRAGTRAQKLTAPCALENTADIGQPADALTRST